VIRWINCCGCTQRNHIHGDVWGD